MSSTCMNYSNHHYTSVTELRLVNHENQTNDTFEIPPLTVCKYNLEINKNIHWMFRESLIIVGQNINAANYLKN